MKSCKKVLLALTFLLLSAKGFSQEDATVPALKKGASLSDKLYSYINTKGKDILYRECGQGCFFVKFKIDAKGYVEDLQLSEGSWNVIDTLVKSAILSTNGQWVASQKKNKVIDSKTFLLPVIYGTGNCNGSVASKVNSASEVLNSIPNINDTIQKGMTYGFLHMIDFGKTKQRKDYYLECTLLNPIFITAPRL